MKTNQQFPLHELELAPWVWAKNRALCAVANWNDNLFEIVNESEKAIQIKIIQPSKGEVYEKLHGEWLQWLPKSAVLNIERYS